MKKNLTIFTLLLILSGFVTNLHSQSVSLESIDGLTEDYKLKVNQEISFNIRLTNNSDTRAAIVNGFRIYSEDGAIWTTTVPDTFSVSPSFASMFDLVFELNAIDVDGVLSDTVGFGGARRISDGFVSNFDEISYRITIGPIPTADSGKTICIDSSFYPPSGYWKWASPDVSPSWDGPHCYTIETLKPSYGTTIITHGWNPDWGEDGGLSNDAYWTISMAKAVIKRLGSGEIYTIVDGEILKLPDTEGTNPSEGEKVVIFDWIEESNRPYFGLLEAASDVLFANLIKGQQESKWSLEQLHFIGHSRGAVVNSEVIQRLGYFQKSGVLPSSISVDNNIHMTTLDAHPWDAFTFNDCISELYTGDPNDYNVNLPNILANTGGTSGVETVPQAVICWENVGFSDNYYQGDCDEAHPSPNGLHNYLGLNNNYMANIYLDDYWDLDWNVKPYTDHSAVHAWYHGTIDTDITTTNDGAGIEIENSFYPNGTRNTRGFNIGKNYSNQDPFSVVYRRSIYSDENLKVEKIFNGDFSMSEGSDAKLPGWTFQGGEGGIELDRISLFNSNKRMKLDKNHPRAVHNYLYIPENATHLKFYYEAENKTAQNPSPDILIVGYLDVNNTSRGSEGFDLNKSFVQDWDSIPVNSFALNQGQIRKLLFQLINPDGDPIEAEVWIDNIHFINSEIDNHQYLSQGNFTLLPSPSTNNKSNLTSLSPIDIRITDPDGLYIDGNISLIDGATYDYFIFNDNDTGVTVTIPFMKAGDYDIEVLPEIVIDSNNTFSIYGYSYEELDSIAIDVAIKDVPDSGFQHLVTYCCIHPLRGNFDGDSDDVIDIVDLVYMVDYQFRNGDAPTCFEEGDVVIDQVIDISDLVFMVDYQFRSGDAPPDCP